MRIKPEQSKYTSKKQQKKLTQTRTAKIARIIFFYVISNARINIRKPI